MKQQQNGFFSDAKHVLFGMLMGGADIIPGVSGGTVALIVGIYERLVAAISHVDRTLVQMVKGGKWREAAEHVDLRFVVALGAGIGMGVVALGSVIHFLLSDRTARPLTLAVFFGAILASSFVVVRLVSWKTAEQLYYYVALGMIGAAFAFWLAGLETETSGAGPSYVYLFVCGMIGICAMILPGISGAYILLLLGVYSYLTHILKELAHLNFVDNWLPTVVVFGAGCSVGLLGFSKILRWLLEHQHSATMAVLAGFMIGALKKIWPFQNDTTPTQMELKEKVFENYIPEAFSREVGLVLLLCVITMVVVLAADRFTGSRERSERYQPDA